MLVYAQSKFKRKLRKPKGEVARKLTSVQISVFKEKMPSYDYSNRRGAGVALHSSLTSTSCHTGRVSVMDPVQLAKESPEVREAIIAKSKRIAIAYSKGAYQYVTDETDAKTIGRKNAV